jgi:hypothetical protein
MVDIVDPFRQPSPTIVDPFAGAVPVVADPFAGAAAPDTSVAQNVGVAARAAYPQATAAGVGALIGSRFGAPGARAGAALGPLALGLGDIAATGYNVAAPYLGAPQVSTPSELIQGGFERAGYGARPETPEQELLSAGVSGGSSGAAQAAAFNVLARRLGPSVARNVFTLLGQQPVVQAGAGAGAAMAPTALREYADVEDPYALMASSLVGAVLGGKATAAAGNVGRAAVDLPRMATTTTTTEIRNQAQRAYRQSKSAGVSYDPAAVTQFGDDLAVTLRNEGFDATLHPKANAALRRIQEAGQPTAPVTFEDLDILRRVARGARLSTDADERRIGRMIIDKLDSFALRPPSGAVVSGDERAAGTAIREARSLWSRMSKSSEIEDLVENAKLSAQGSGGRLDEAIRAQFASLARDIHKGRNPGFTPEEVANIERIAKGETMRFGTAALSALAPSSSLRGLTTAATQAGGMALAANDPYAAAFAIPTMAAGMGARGARNAMAQIDAARLAAGVRRGDVTAPFAARPVPLMSPTLQQILSQTEPEPANAFAR